MTPAQLQFLASVAEKIPRLFKAIAEGNIRAEYHLGSRTLEGRQVRLILVAEVIDPGDNPLSTHSKPMPGYRDEAVAEANATKNTAAES